MDFTRSQVLSGLPAAAFCVWYVLKKHWLANNTLGLAFSIQVPRTLTLKDTRLQMSCWAPLETQIGVRRAERSDSVTTFPHNCFQSFVA